MKELFLFIKKNISSAIFGIYILVTVFLVKYLNFTWISDFDLLFFLAILFQISLLISKKETKKEFFVIILFHLLAMIMEIFKTSESVKSWVYPGVENSMWVVFAVPLFAGFMYSAVGSYISCSHKIFKIKYIKFPKLKYLLTISILIYLNFFSHHYLFDLRYIIFVLTILIFWKTKIEYKIYEKKRKINFLFYIILMSILIWIAENMATFLKVWVYPNQEIIWKIVSLNKIGSWFLLLVLSFSVISIIYRKKD